TVTLAETHNRIPHWLTEACAVFEQPDRRNYQAVKMLVAATRRGRLFPVKELDWGFIRPQRAGDRSLAYAQSEWILEYIIDSRGYETVLKMLRAFGDGMSQDDVFRKILGVSQEDFDAQFRRWARQTVRKWGFDPQPPPDYARAARAARDRPNDPAAQADLALALYYKRDLRRAEAAARKALSIDPNDTPALSVLAVALDARGACDEAIQVARKLQGIEPASPFAAKVLARCHIARKQWAQAIAALEKLQQCQPLDPFSYQQLAAIYQQLGRPEKALPNLIHLHRHTMRDSKYARQIAEIYRAMGKDDEALAYFRQVTHIDPYQPNAYEAMAAIYRSQRRYDEAVAAIEKVRMLEPRSADAWAKAAMMRYLAGRAARNADELLDARRAAAKALEIDPQSRAREVIERIDAALESLEKTK
ncbi:MAG: tetratricopeptide repeat protein, partial [Planctomycetes bacterium]|nr:tetratricopeptide repeat protein [Planctomycetota bacterium]